MGRPISALLFDVRMGSRFPWREQIESKTI